MRDQKPPIRPVPVLRDRGGSPLLAGIGRVGVRAPGVLVVLELGEPPREVTLDGCTGWALSSPPAILEPPRAAA